MKLELENGTVVDNPTAAQIDSALASLDGIANSFAILSESSLDYIQTSGSVASGFVLEFQQNSVEEHYRALDASIPLDHVQAAFRGYLAHAPDWRAGFSWRHEDLAETVAWNRAGALMLTIGMAAIIATLWLLIRGAG